MEHKPSITLYIEWICGSKVVRLLITCIISSYIYAYEIHAVNNLKKPAARICRATSLKYVISSVKARADTNFQAVDEMSHL